MSKELKNYYKACEALKDKFLEALYPNEPEYYDDAYWIAECIGEVLTWGDWCVDMNKIVDYFKYDFTPDKFFEWYDQWIEKEGINMKNFKYLTK